MGQVDDAVSGEVDQTVVSMSPAKMDEVSTKGIGQCVAMIVECSPPVMRVVTFGACAGVWMHLDNRDTYDVAHDAPSGTKRALVNAFVYAVVWRASSRLA